jgi:hypothetical protein
MQMKQRVVAIIHGVQIAERSCKSEEGSSPELQTECVVVDTLICSSIIE